MTKKVGNEGKPPKENTGEVKKTSKDTTAGAKDLKKNSKNK